MAIDFMRIFKGISFAGQATAPSSPANGDVYYDTTLQKLRCYQNGVWVNLSDSDGTVLLADGSAAAPSLAFTSDTDTGLYRQTTNTLGFTTAGVARLALTAGGTLQFQSAAGQDHLIFTDNSASALRLASDTGTGGGGNIRLYGSTHATLANRIEFWNGTTAAERGSISSLGAWIIGGTGGTQTHIINGQTVLQQVSTASQAQTQLTNTGTGGVLSQILSENASGRAVIRAIAGNATAGSKEAYVHLRNRDSTQSNWFNGLYQTNDFHFRHNTTDDVTLSTLYGSISTAGAWVLGASGGTQTHQVWGTSLRLDANVASTASFVVNNLNTGAASSGLFIDTDGTGDAFLNFGVNNAGTTFALGIDNSDSDTLKFTTGTTPSNGTTYGTLSTSGVWVLGQSGGSQIHVVEGSLRTVNRGSFNATVLDSNSIFRIGDGTTLTGLVNAQQRGIRNQVIFTSSTTTNGYVYHAQGSTENAVFTVPAFAQFRAENQAKGAASTITNYTSFSSAIPTQGTNNAVLADNEIYIGNWFINSTSTNDSLISGHLNLAGQKELRLQDTTGGQYVGHRAPGTVGSSHTYTWPSALPGSNQILQSDSSGNLSWVAASGGGDVNNGGNSFGANMTIGTNDAFSLQFETNNIVKMALNSAGDLSLSRNDAGNVVGLTIENTSTTVGLTRADLLLKVDDNSTGSARIRMQVGVAGNQFATIGKDAGTSDLFQIQGAGNGFSGAQIAISNSGAVGIGRSIGTSGFLAAATENVALRVASVDSGLFTGVTQSAIEVGSTSASMFTSSGTSNNFVFRSNIGTGNGARTTALLAHYWVTTPSLGTSHTVTRQTYFGGTPTTIATNNAFISDNLSYTGNWFINSTDTNPSLFAGPVQFASGTAAAPSITFSADTNTGIYRFGTDTLGVACNGTYVSRFGESSGSGFQVFNMASAGLASISMAAADGTFVVSAGTGSSSGGQVRFYGNTHATKANYLEFNSGSTIHGFKDGNGAWTLGTSGSTQIHTINGRTNFLIAGVNGYFVTTNPTVSGSTNTASIGFGARHIAPAAATGSVEGFRSEITTDNAAFVTSLLIDFNASSSAKGAASTITRRIAFLAQSTQDGTNNARFADNTSFTGNWFINSTSVNKSQLTGALALARFDVASAATIAALDSTRSFVKLTGSTATTIQGIAAGVDGQRLTVVNLTGQNMTISHENGSASASDRITTMTGADVVTTANGAAEFVYDTGSSRWICLYVTA